MIRYMSVLEKNNRSFDDQITHEIENDIYLLNKKPPDVPYIKIDIKIIGKEERFINDRDEKPKSRHHKWGNKIKSILIGGWN